MQVQPRAATGGAARDPALIRFAAPAQLVSLGATESLLSDTLTPRSEKRERLRQDDERVQGVVEALQPAVTQQIQQERFERADARQGVQERVQARDDAQSRASFKDQLSSTLRDGRGNAGSAPNAPPPNRVAVPAEAPPSPPAGSPAESDSVQSPPLATKSNSIPGRPISESGAADSAPQPARPSSTPISINGPSITNLAGSAQATAQVAGQSSPSAAIAAASAAEATQPSSAALTGTSPAGEGKASTVAPAEARSGSAQGASRSAKAQTPEKQENTAPDDDRSAENVQRMLRVLRGAMLRERSTTVIRLDPPELGLLRLEMDLRKNAMTLRVKAETDAARDLLRGELDLLRNGLQASGIRLEQVEIAPLVSATDVPVQRDPERGPAGDHPAARARRTESQAATTVDDDPGDEAFAFAGSSALLGRQGVNVIV